MQYQKQREAKVNSSVHEEEDLGVHLERGKMPSWRPENVIKRGGENSKDFGA